MVTDFFLYLLILNLIIAKAPEEMSIPIYRPFKDGPFQMTMRKIITSNSS